jgi:hypothetical protein
VAKLVYLTLRRQGAAIQTIARQPGPLEPAGAVRLQLREATDVLPTNQASDLQATTVHVAVCDGAEWVATVLDLDHRPEGAAVTACMFAFAGGRQLDVYGVTTRQTTSDLWHAPADRPAPAEICSAGPHGLQKRLQAGLGGHVVSTGQLSAMPSDGHQAPSAAGRALVSTAGD